MTLDLDGLFDAFDGALALADHDDRERFRRVLGASRERVRLAAAELVRQALEEVNTAAAGVIGARLVDAPDGIAVRVARAVPGDGDAHRDATRDPASRAAPAPDASAPHDAAPARGSNREAGDDDPFEVTFL